MKNSTQVKLIVRLKRIGIDPKFGFGKSSQDKGWYLPGQMITNDEAALKIIEGLEIERRIKRN